MSRQCYSSFGVKKVGVGVSLGVVVGGLTVESGVGDAEVGGRCSVAAR